MHRILWMVSLLATFALLQGCGGLRTVKRPTNVEVRILAQSCFQGEVVPCG